MIRKIITSKWLQFFVIIISVIFLASTVLIDSTVRQRSLAFSSDTFNKLFPLEASGLVYIIDIDEESLNRYGQWPWPRNVLADLVTNLKSLGVGAIAFDMVFPESDRSSPRNIIDQLKKYNSKSEFLIQGQSETLPDNDEIFALAIKDAGNVVLGFTDAYLLKDALRKPLMKTMVKVINSEDAATSEVLGKIFSRENYTTNLFILEQAAAGNGSFIATPDPDGVIRKVPIIFKQKKADSNITFYYPALAVDALRVILSPSERFQLSATNKGSIDEGSVFSFLNGRYLVLSVGHQSIWNVPISSNGYFMIKFGHFDRRDEYIPAYQVLDKTYHGAIAEKLEKATVFVGTSAEGLKDIRTTPLDRYLPGVEVHANIADQIIQEDYLYRNSSADIIEGIYILILGCMIAIVSVYMGLLSLFIVCVLGIGTAVVSATHLYSMYGYIFDPIYISVSIFLIFVFATMLNYTRSEIARRKIKGAFGLYISPDFMKELTDNPDKLTLGGEIRDLTVMFTDIRNFTTISESMTPEALINTMNDFLTPMSDVVMKTRGTIDKYMGDAMMAFWNAPLDDVNHARHAVEAALTMKKALDPVNAALKLQAEKEGREPLLLAAGIGINTGPCAVGNMGSKQRFAYSALGDAVNLASRLEGQTKAYGLDLLVGEETVRHIPNFAVIEIDLIRVKGKTKPVRIYTVLGTGMMGKREVFLNFRDTHNKFLSAYRSQDFKMAMEWVRECQETDFGKMLLPYYRIMAKRMQEFQTNKPPQDWDGVYVATSK